MELVVNFILVHNVCTGRLKISVGTVGNTSELEIGNKYDSFGVQAVLKKCSFVVSVPSVVLFVLYLLYLF